MVVATDQKLTIIVGKVDIDPKGDKSKFRFKIGEVSIHSISDMSKFTITVGKVIDSPCVIS